MSDRQYYDPEFPLFRGAELNFIVGGRGIGKTYGFKKLVLDRCTQNNTEFIWLRRYNTELRPARTTFLDDLPEEYAVQYKFGHGGLRVAGGEGEKDGRIVGYFMSLSTAASQKSVAFPRVEYIIYDEVIAPAGRRYLSDEPAQYLSFYSTVARNRNGVVGVFLGNAESVMCPYYAAWGIEPWTGQRITRYHDGYLLYERAPDWRGEAPTRAEKFLAAVNPDLWDYAVANKYRDEGGEMLAKKQPANARPWAVFVFPEMQIGIFHSPGGKWWCGKGAPAGTPRVAMHPSAVGPDSPMADAATPILLAARAGMMRGDMMFQDARIRGMMWQSVGVKKWV